MEYPRYDPVGQASFSPLENTTYTSPISYQEPFHPHDGAYFDNGDIGAGIEMEHRGSYGSVGYDSRPVSAVAMPMSYNSNARIPEKQYSTSSTVFPNNDDTQAFLNDPANHVDTFHMTNSFQPLKANTKKQLWSIIIGSTSRFLVTAALCGGYILANHEFSKKGALNEKEKKLYNTITTAISIALGLNIASSFKDMALNMRWPILKFRKRSLVELDLILSADSLSRLAKLALVTKRPTVIIACVLWLFINLLAQAGIAMLSLTYGFDPCYSDVLFSPGNVSIPNLDHFYPPRTNDTSNNLSEYDEQYTAHVYGQAMYDYEINTTNHFPNASAIYKPLDAMLYYNLSESLVQLRFADSPTNKYPGTYSVYSDRTINVTYACESRKVTANGNGMNDTITVDGIPDTVTVSAVGNSTTYFRNWPSDLECGSNCSAIRAFDCGERCSVVHAFEASDTDAWYYQCNITMGSTYNDTGNVSYVSDAMAKIAAASIAQIGYRYYLEYDPYIDYQAVQIYPRNSPWGANHNGNASEMGHMMALFALGTIAGASLNAPLKSYKGMAPSGGVYLNIGHPKFFYLIIGLIIICHLVFMIVVAVLSNTVMVGPDGHLSMSLLLKPIADKLEGVSGGEENKAFRDAKRTTNVVYDKNQGTGKWRLNMVHR